jgi:hypothetical protein
MINRAIGTLFYLVPAAGLFCLASYLRVYTEDDYLWPWITGGAFCALGLPFLMEMLAAEIARITPTNNEDEDE